MMLKMSLDVTINVPVKEYDGKMTLKVMLE